MADLELRSVVKRFGAAQMIHGVDLRSGEGESWPSSALRGAASRVGKAVPTKG